MVDQFVHLHCHTLFSTLDGVAKPSDYAKASKERGWTAFTATEHGVMSSIPDMFFAAKEYNLKYFPGCEVYFSDYEKYRKQFAEEGLKLGKELQNRDEELFIRMRKNRHLTVLCKNWEGYQNLLRINLEAYEKNLYGGRPRVDFDLLNKYKSGLIILSGCLNGAISYEINRGNLKTGKISDKIIGALDYLKMFNNIWGDDFYVEIQMPNIRQPDFNDITVFRLLTSIAQKLKKKMVLTGDSHYMNPDDFDIQKVMMAIDQDTTITDPGLFISNSREQYYKTREQLRETFNTCGYSDIIDVDVFEKSCDTTLEIADKCKNFEFNTKPKLPSVNNANQLLKETVVRGFRDHGLHKDKNKYVVDGVEVTPMEQLKIELERIIEKGYSSYFLITKNIVDRAKQQYGQGAVGPGRGSAAGSLLCYCLGITTINPLKWKLSFSRFLSPSRGGQMLKVSME